MDNDETNESFIKYGFASGSIDKLKPSELPSGTFIMTSDGYYFEKSEDVFHSLYDHCEGCGVVVKPEGVEEPDGYPRIFVDPDSYFNQFKVVSVPYRSKVIFDKES